MSFRRDTDIGYPHATVNSNRKVVAVAGTAERLASDVEATEAIITAELDNTGLIAVGGSNVVAALATRIGSPLDAGDSVVIPCKNLKDIWLDSTVSGDGVTYTYSSRG